MHTERAAVALDEVTPIAAVGQVNLAECSPEAVRPIELVALTLSVAPDDGEAADNGRLSLQTLFDSSALRRSESRAACPENTVVRVSLNWLPALGLA